MTKLEKIKHTVNLDSYTDLRYYGEYSRGLTIAEIKDYIRARASKMRVEGLYKKFVDISGVNTMSMHTCPACNNYESLMYRHDVVRFADVLFGKTKSTYFD